VREVDVVIPVYDGYEETKACMQTVLRTVTHEWARIVVINDCSPDPDITQYLRKLQQITLDLLLLQTGVCRMTAIEMFCY
jgi:hypothetical protein